MAGSNPWVWDKETKQDVYPPAVVDLGLEIEHGELPGWLLRPENSPRLVHHLSRYFTADYTGRLFETLVAISDPARFTPWDIFAVEALSVRVPPASILWLLDHAGPANKLLCESRAEMGTLQKEVDWSLWTCQPKLLESKSNLSQLYGCLKGQRGIGSVTASKLLAAKFPGVIPIRDAKVAGLIGLRSSKSWWIPIRKILESDGGNLVDYLRSLPVPHAGGAVTVLRRLDVILWMEAKARFPKEPDSIKSRFGSKSA